MSAIAINVPHGLLPNSNQLNSWVCALKTLEALRESNYSMLVSYGQNPIVEDSKSNWLYRNTCRLTLSFNKHSLLNSWSQIYSVKIVSKNGHLIPGLLKFKWDRECNIKGPSCSLSKWFWDIMPIKRLSTFRKFPMDSTFSTRGSHTLFLCYISLSQTLSPDLSTLSSWFPMILELTLPCKSIPQFVNLLPFAEMI